jgi:uncharacterized protein
MLALISPAKTLDYTSPLPELPTTLPRLPAETEKLVAGAAKLSARKLSELMHISDKLAKLNVDRYRGFAEQPERPALFAFAGDVYTGFEVRSLDEAAIAFAQDHVRILSGLYGLLRPLDRIRPYRMEMGTRWAPGRPKDLYGFWGKRIGELLSADLAEDGSGVIVNLASREYWQAAEQALPSGTRVITIDFKEQGPSGLRFNSFAAKRARGMVARHICEHRLTDPEALKGFDSDGYAFDPDASEGDIWRFIRR